jgi:hypothetical protein
MEISLRLDRKVYRGERTHFRLGRGRTQRLSVKTLSLPLFHEFFFWID